MNSTPAELAEPDAETPDLPEVESLSLAADFSPVSREQWEQSVAGVLRRSGYDGDDPVGQLVTRTLDGIDVQPLYTRQHAADSGRPGVTPYVRGSRAQGSGPAGWDLRAHHARPDAQALLDDLENGATSLWLELGPGRIPLSDLSDLLADVQLDLAPLAIDAGDQAPAAAELLRDLAGERGIDPHALSGTLGLDPIGLQARSGAQHTLRDAVAWALRCADETPLLRAITVDALPYHEAGGSDAQELGCALATGVAYLRALRSAGMPLTDATAQLEFRYAATADQFSTIAKLRAARLLWSRVAEVAGLAAVGQRQHAVSSTAMATRRDPWGNLLRGTLACVGAGSGGADAVTVLPFDSAIGQPDAFSRRIARNTQTLLMEESYLSRVIDPAGGSWYVEQLTRALARQAWTAFQRIEAGGGIVSGLSDGTVADAVAVTAEERRARLARRQQRIVGVTDFVLLDAPDVTRDPWPAEPAGGLPRIRYAADYEALRDRSDAMLATTGARPTVLLVPVGTGRGVSASTTFAAGALQPGGIATPMSSGALPPDVGAACLCVGADVDFAELASAGESLRAEGATMVLAAGAPPGTPGIDVHLSPGADLVAALNLVVDGLEVSA